MTFFSKNVMTLVVIKSKRDDFLQKYLDIILFTSFGVKYF